MRSHPHCSVGKYWTTAFAEEGRTYRCWQAYGGFDDEAKVKAVCVPMGASFEGEQLGGFLFNENVKKGQKNCRAHFICAYVQCVENSQIPSETPIPGFCPSYSFR